MKRPAGIHRLFRLPWRSRETIRDDVDEEIAFHLDMRAEELMATHGIDPEDARERAEREFGDVESAKRALHDEDREIERASRRGAWLDALRQDVKFAVRTLRRSPGFTAVAVLTLGLGIGASTTIFSLVDAAMLRAVPFDEPDRMAVVWGVAGPDRDIRGASHPEIMDWRTMSRTFQTLSVYDETTVALSGEGPATQLDAEIVSPSYFSILRVDAARGRAFGAEAGEPGAAPVAVIGHGLWQSRFGGADDVLGRTVPLDGRSYQVVGIMPEGFRGLSFDTEVWLPFAAAVPNGLESRGNRWLAALGRLEPGIAPAAAQEDLTAVARRLEQRFPDVNRERSAMLLPLGEYYLGGTRTLLWVLLGSVVLLLVIACANVTNLQLVRATARRREISLRHALGAGRGRIVRQLVTEGLVLSLLGGVAGLAFGYAGLRVLVPLVPSGTLPAFVEPSLDLRAAGFALGLATLAGVLFGLVPALRGAGSSLMAALRDGGRGTAHGSARFRRPSLQQAFVVAEVAVALILLVGAGLMIRSVLRQLAVEPGFRSEGVVAARLDLPTGEYDRQARRAFADELTDRLRGIPGVESAAIASAAPLRGNWRASILVPDGRPGDEVRFYMWRVSPDYFETLGIPIIRGRGLTAADANDSSVVAVVSDIMAERLWPGEDPVGKRVRAGSADGPAITVVGVAGAVHHRSITNDLASPGEDPDLYLPYGRSPASTLDVIARSDRGDPAALVPLIRREVEALEPTVPLYRVEPLAAALARQTSTERFTSFLLILFGGLALALAAVGIYGVIAFLVGLRTREIAIRMAIGAGPGSVRSLVLRQGLRLVSVGMALGLVGALAASRALAGVLYGVRATDPLTFATVSAFLLAVALAANYLPARRATRVDPQLALRAE